MAEYPITMTAKSVRDTMEPDTSIQKTQTRRVITIKGIKEIGKCKECGHMKTGKARFPLPEDVDLSEIFGPPIVVRGKAQFIFLGDKGTYTVRCPYGDIGDRLWVKETFAFEDGYNHYPPSMVPEGTPVFYRANTDEDWKRQSNGKLIGRWRPPMFMPRWASRLELETVNIDVQRIQDITEEQAKAEGVKHRGHIDKVMHSDEPQGAYTYVFHYKILWDIINAKRGYPWELNNWVWVITYMMVSRKLEPEEK